MLPLKTAISDVYPNPSNAIARAGFAALWDAINQFQQASEFDLASAATLDIGSQVTTKLRITGTTGITSLGTNYRGPIQLRFSGAVTITHNATTLRCPGGASYTTAANSVLMAWPIASVSGTLDGWQLVVLDGVIPITQGGTGATSASAAFAAIKQAATSSATGAVELSTDAEAQIHADTVRAVTPANLGATVLGMSQTWQDMSASRTGSTTYTNSTGRSIQVSISLVTSTSCTINYIVGGISGVGSSYGAASGTTYVSFVVPAGATYSCSNNFGTSVVSKWLELR